jgi:hypothetical protein
VLEIDSRSFTDFLDDTIHFLNGFVTAQVPPAQNLLDTE